MRKDYLKHTAYTGNTHVKDKQDNALTTEEEQAMRWVESHKIAKE
jgi:hypothetical protein